MLPERVVTIKEAPCGGSIHAQALARLTEHAARRTQQRAISRLCLSLALRHGMQIEQNGATVFFLGRRHLPAELAPADAARVEGTTVVVARDGSIITTFRCRRVPGQMRRRRRPWRSP